MKNDAKGRPSFAGRGATLAVLGAAAVAALLLAFAFPGLHLAVRIAGIVLAGIIGAGVAFQTRRRPAVARAGAWVSVVYLAALALTAVLWWSREWLPADAQELQELLERHRASAVWIYFAACFLQPIALPLPEALTVMAGSAVLGAFAAFVAGFVGTTLGIFSMFTLVRFGGRRLVARLATPEQLERYYRFVARNEVLILVVLFVIPVLPDEVICVGAGLSGVSAGRFALIAALAKLLTSFTLAYSIELGEWLSLRPTDILLIVGAIALAAVAYPHVKRLVRRGREAGGEAGCSGGTGGKET